MSRARGPLGSAFHARHAAQQAGRCAAVAFVSALCCPVQGQAADGEAATQHASYSEPLLSPIVAKTSLASRWAGLSAPQCLAEVARRKLGVTRFRGAAVGVATPVRVTGPIGGVRFVTPGSKSPYGILDCRLALALSELAPLLKRYDVIEARVDNMYRPHAHLPGKQKPSQHSFGLAADLTRLKRADGTELVVERDFQGTLGEPVCGEGARARSELSSDASALRDLICEVARSGLFHHILTPNHDQAHHDHFHLDIARGARQRIIE
jgi:Extensin-like protein C-terminus